MNNNKIKIIKASGEEAIFNVSKLIASLKKSGASQRIALEIATDIESELFSGMTTKEIYKKAFAQLKKHSRPTAARYNLKKSILELGTSGFPFEKYVAALLAHEGFRTRVGVIVKGHCVNHEIDILAQKDNFHYMCECKFHNQQGKKNNVKIPLYIQSRFKDVDHTWQSKAGHSDKIHQACIFTNTRFTDDAMEYGRCAGIKLISWDYPKNESIKARIDKSGVYPITCLTTLTLAEKKALIKLGKIIIKDICDRPKVLKKIGVNISRHQRILEEACGLIKI